MVQQRELSPRIPRFSYPSMDRFMEVCDAKNHYRYGQHELYPRNGFPSLAQVENHIAQLVGIEEGYALLTGSGMSAIVTAFEIAHPTAGDVILHGFESYSKSGEYIVDDLVPRGVKPVAVSIQEFDRIENALRNHRPTIVFFETVSNGAEMEVLDIQRFLALPVLHEVNPLIILDNTLPTDSHLSLAKFMKESDIRIIGVESGTKSYVMNQDLAGIIYTYNDELLQKLYRKRCRGDSPGTSLVATLAGVIPPTKEQFDRENRTIAHNTAQLARGAWEVVDPSKLLITHHGLPNHPQRDLAERLYPDGATPVFFISPMRHWDSIDVLVEDTAQAIVDSFMSHGLEPDKDFYIAESFGFNKTGISIVPRGYVRIAGGLETPEQLSVVQQALVEGLEKALKKQEIKQKGLRFGLNNQFAIISRPGKEEDCAQESLSRLGYDGYALFPEGSEVSNADIENSIPGATEVSYEIFQSGHNPEKAYLVIGIKKSNGRGHWYLRIGNDVINPEKGEPEPAEAYENREIETVILNYEIPPGHLLTQPTD